MQVVVNKSGAELAVERQKAHGSMIMAAIAMKKQAFETAKEMHRLFPADDTWCEALQDAAREYMAACKMDVLQVGPASQNRIPDHRSRLAVRGSVKMTETYRISKHRSHRAVGVGKAMKVTTACSSTKTVKPV